MNQLSPELNQPAPWSWTWHPPEWRGAFLLFISHPVNFGYSSPSGSKTLEHNHACLFLFGLWELSCTNRVVPTKWKVFAIWTVTEKVCDTWSKMHSIGGSSYYLLLKMQVYSPSAGPKLGAWVSQTVLPVFQAAFQHFTLNDSWCLVITPWL